MASSPPKEKEEKSPSPTAEAEAGPSAAEPAAIEAEPAPIAGSDADSSYEEQFSTFTASLSSSVLNYPIENGRRYHAYRAGAYPLPNDEPEIERLDLAHAVMTKTLGDRLYLAPLEKEKVLRVLDCGTGTGVWAVEIGDEFPQAEVLGNDLSAIQPNWLPPNVKFEVDDLESPWTHQRPFDFIFSRYMCACILDWPKYVQVIFDNTSPGGYAEFQDFNLLYYSEDGSLTEESSTVRWCKALLGAAEAIGRDPCPGPKLEGWLKDAGFADVTHRKFKIPIGAWPKDPKLKEIGLFNITQILDGLEGFSLRLMCDVLGWQKDEVTVLLAGVRKELKSPHVHAQLDFHVVYGKKPE